MPRSTADDVIHVREVEDLRRELERAEHERDEARSQRAHLLDLLEVTGEAQRQRRLEILQELTFALSRASTVDDVARIVVEEVSAKTAAPRGGLWKLSDDGRALELLYDKGYTAALRTAVARVPVDSSMPLARVIATRMPCWLSSRRDYEERFGEAARQTYPVRTSEDMSFFCAPLLVEGCAVGCLSINYATPHEFSDDERRFIEALVDQCALALHRAQLLASEFSLRKESEREQTRFRAMFDQALEGIALLNDDLCIVDVNPALCAVFRRSREALVGVAIRELVAPDERSDYQLRAEEFRLSGRIDKRERRMLMPDGALRWFEVSATANVVSGLHMVTFRDVEDRKRAAMSAAFLEEASRMFSSSLEPDKTLAAIARLAVPKLADWAAIDLSGEGGKLERVVVQHVDPAKIELAHAIMLRRSPDAETLPERVVRTGETHLIAHITDEMLEQALAHDPAYLAMVRASGVASVLVIPFSSRGRRLGAITFAFGESRRVFSDDDVRFAEELARRAGLAFENALAYSELRERVDTSNRLFQLTSALASTRTTDSVAETLRVHAPVAVGSDVADVWLVDDASRALVCASARSDARADSLRSIPLTSDWPAARVLRNRRAEFIPSRQALLESSVDARPQSDRQAWAVLPLVTAADHAMGVLSFGFRQPRSFAEDYRQLTAAVADQCAVALDRARAYESEASAMRKKDEFLAMLGHELRNPLAPILTATSLIRLRGTATERELGILERQSRHLVRLVDDLLDISRITAGKLTLRREVVEIDEVIAQAVESASKWFDDKRIRLEVDVPQSGLLVHGDRGRLVQVFTNVLVNAAKFTPSGRSVYVQAARVGDAAAVDVRDEGEGIPADVLPNLFTPFTQGPQASDRRDGGMGLGLAIARSLVEAHGGSIVARSAGAGQGTTLAVRLPIHAVLTEGAGPRPSDRHSAFTNSRKHRVLVVDDNADAAELMSILLTDLGFEVLTARDGPEALAITASALPDTAVLDIGLPGMDGYELAAEIQKQHGERSPVLIALTGYAQPTDRERALGSGFQAHFAKPVDVSALVATLAANAQRGSVGAAAS